VPRELQARPPVPWIVGDDPLAQRGEPRRIAGRGIEPGQRLEGQIGALGNGLDRRLQDCRRADGVGAAGKLGKPEVGGKDAAVERQRRAIRLLRVLGSSGAARFLSHRRLQVAEH
jgi:hypothetical protein